MNFYKLANAVFDMHQNRSKNNVVILGGMHGDEPAGNIAAESYKNVPGIVVINNINNTGKRRLNGKDVNRHFETNDSTSTNNIILQQVLQSNPKLVIDLHEDVDARGVYVYCSRSLSANMKIILQRHNIILAKFACGDKVNNGVVDHGRLPTAGTLEKACTKHNIPYYTFETPTCWPLPTRVDILKLLVNEVLKEL